ncbi:hypothetical protein GDO81_022960 [Engystomops pustulosus]|uniref:Telomerase RNA component interacting RNase n=1 Tax=Engystomops pustulosus TaxID=76066 RepID=A0AAV6ZWG8_ENGPU|nr:hypothetical protein GDO81_022960 [Engystomops pustulosus]KAG8550673.1 hypothetical protein GDO81_022960 [Engystomops pustulosus]
MAEESPRPDTEEDTEEEEGEEAAEAPVKVLQEKCEDEAAPPESPPASPPRRPAAPPACPAAPPARQPAPPACPAAPPAYHLSSPAVSGVNLFANDGSFMELFKKKMEATGGEEQSKSPEEEKKPEPDKRRPVSFVGKRRGGAKLALKTGIVTKKPKTDEEEIMTNKGGAWAQYMAEVKKYKAHQCSDDDKTRPLVK